jgi:hypothetical protein
VRDLRDRALIATLTYGFARVGAALKMRVEGLQSKGTGWLIRRERRQATYDAVPSCARRGATRGAIQSDAFTLPIFVTWLAGFHLPRATRFCRTWPNRLPIGRFDD